MSDITDMSGQEIIIFSNYKCMNNVYKNYEMIVECQVKFCSNENKLKVILQTTHLA